MSKRIRYSKETGGTLRSNSSFKLSDGKVVSVVLDGKSYSLVTKHGDVVASGSASSDVMLKRKVKDVLGDLGVRFEEETRLTDKHISMLKAEGIEL